MMELAWEERPAEVANLLNPAFCGEVLFQSIREYDKITSRSFPFLLSFLVLPLILHQRTRESISKGTKAPLHGWLHAHQETRIGFADRARRLVPVTRESIIFIAQHGIIDIRLNGVLAPVRRRKKALHYDDEMSEYYDKAKIVGRWFARAGPTSTIYSMLGVKP